MCTIQKVHILTRLCDASNEPESRLQKIGIMQLIIHICVLSHSLFFLSELMDRQLASLLSPHLLGFVKLNLEYLKEGSVN